MHLRNRLCTWFLVLLSLAVSGCGSDKAVNLDILKQRAAQETSYSFDYYRKLGTDEIRGKLYFKEDNIRFELYGDTEDDLTVTIVNQDDNKNYIYNTKLGRGEIQEPAFFAQDVPLPGEIMSVLNTGNTKFMKETVFDGQQCSAFQATEVQFYGYKFSGEIWISNETGIPIFMEGYRGKQPVTFKYSALSFEEQSSQLYEPPAGISLE